VLECFSLLDNAKKKKKKKKNEEREMAARLRRRDALNPSLLSSSPRLLCDVIAYCDAQ